MPLLWRNEKKGESVMPYYYTGVGARKTPNNILAFMTKIAEKLATVDHVLRSGGAAGADSAFERGAGTFKQIFHANQATQQAMDIAAYFHPAWNSCSPFVKKLHGRNAFQVLGINLNDPSKFLICWTPGGGIVGGTGTAISIAEYYKVPVYNLAIAAHLELFTNWIRT
jgi:hypothetical protein